MQNTTVGDRAMKAAFRTGVHNHDRDTLAGPRHVIATQVSTPRLYSKLGKMGRDTIQLEDAVSTISQEYLLEFLSEYFIPENLHPELPGPGDHIVDFLKGKIGVFPTVVAWRTAATKDDKPKANTYSVVDVATLNTHQIDLFNLIKALNPTKVKIGTRQRTAHEVPLLTATASRMIQIVDATKLSTSSGTPSTMERSPLDFSNEDAPLPLTQGAEAGVHGPAMTEQEIPVTDDAGATKAAVEPDLEKEVISMGPTIKKKRRQRDAGEGGSNAPAKVLRKDHDAARTKHSARGGKSLADMSVDTELAIYVQETQEPPVTTQSVNDPDPLSTVMLTTYFYCSVDADLPKRKELRETKTPRNLNLLLILLGPQEASTNRDGLRHLPNDEFLSQYNIKLVRQVAMGSQLRLRFEQEAKLLKKSVAQLEAEINMKKVVEGKNSEVTKELEDLRMRFSGLEVGNAQLSPAGVRAIGSSNGRKEDHGCF
ncbi:hypothetical protein Tco_0950283 [Tanacetum coccineum]